MADESLGLQFTSIDLEHVSMSKQLAEVYLGDEQVLDRDIKNMMAQ
jgi:hypothetical protein